MYLSNNFTIKICERQDELGDQYKTELFQSKFYTAVSEGRTKLTPTQLG